MNFWDRRKGLVLQLLLAACAWREKVKVTVGMLPTQFPSRIVQQKRALLVAGGLVFLLSQPSRIPQKFPPWRKWLLCKNSPR